MFESYLDYLSFQVRMRPRQLFGSDGLQSLTYAEAWQRAGHVAAAAQRGPDQAVQVNVNSARPKSPLTGIAIRIVGRLVDLGDARFGRVVAEVDSNEAARYAQPLRNPH